jgi:hypothetical protein
VSAHWSNALVKLRACGEAVEWAKTQPSLAAAWDACERADWLLWLVGRTDASAPWSEERKPLVRCANACAAEGLKYAKDGKAKDVAEACISITQAWCAGAASREDVREARAAVTAAYAAAYAAASAAYAASAADAADAAAYAAYAASSTAARATAYAAYAAAYAYARTRMLRELCVIVRAHFPNPPALEVTL